MLKKWAYGSEVEVHGVQLDHQGSSSTLKHFNTFYIWSVTLVHFPVKSELGKYGSILFNRIIPPLLQWDKWTDWRPCSWQLWEDAHDLVQDWYTLHCFISHRCIVHPVSIRSHLSKQSESKIGRWIHTCSPSEVISSVCHYSSATHMLMGKSLFMALPAEGHGNSQCCQVMKIGEFCCPSLKDWDSWGCQHPTAPQGRASIGCALKPHGSMVIDLLTAGEQEYAAETGN